ncbi:MAG: hypothetical protein QXW82_02875 [Candidatus Bathyarchaeia archaeon]
MKKSILALSLALFLALPTVVLIAPAYADGSKEDAQNLPVKTAPLWRNMWYKFETPLITLIFPANGTKPMFLWWYTGDNSTIYVVKFKGLIEYLTFDFKQYNRSYNAEESVMKQMIKEKFIEPKINRHANREQIRENLMSRLMEYLTDLHPAYMPFSACKWSLEGPQEVSRGDVSYWSFNFTLTKVPMPGFRFAENNIMIKCRFYSTNATEVLDDLHSYTVAAGQLKFDFVVSNWEWNIDKIRAFVDWLNESPFAQYQIEIPVNKAGLALWVNMASIKTEDLNAAENEVQSREQETVETMSRMRTVAINDEYYDVSENKSEREFERQVRLTNLFRNRVRIKYERMTGEGNISGFLEFVPWARLLDETGGTVEYVDVTASYISGGGHLRLFICYPYFGNYTLEHDPTIGLTYGEETVPEATPTPKPSPLVPTPTPPTVPTPTPTQQPPESTPQPAPASPTPGFPTLLAILIGATLVIALAVAALKLLKKPINLLTIK